MERTNHSLLLVEQEIDQFSSGMKPTRIHCKSIQVASVVYFRLKHKPYMKNAKQHKILEINSLMRFFL